MSRVLTIAALGEAATGIALIAVPSLVGRLLLGEDLTGPAVVVARILGLALVGLAIACRIGAAPGMLAYSLGATVYLSYLGLAADGVGLLLWPAAALHAALSTALAASMIRRGKR